MVQESAAARPADARVSTGNPSLDAMLEGGLVARRPYLIVGPSGTGKTSLALQFLCDGVRRGERVLLVTLEEPPNEARVNHRGMEPVLDRVEVFDAIPDIMRYERTPFKDISSVRSAVPFREVPLRIRTSPELASVEVTITALEQMLRTEVTRKNYTRLVVDSLTALQYFCMKGFDPIAGAQSLLRFLSDLRVTTILTVEAPLEDVETPERMLARGEIRLFRWELDGQTVRAIGVEKFRGSSHDVRLHPYRIGPQGIDVNLEVTISRDTRQIIEPIVRRPAVAPTVAPAASFVSAVTPLVDEVRDLILLGADVASVRSAIEAALEATEAGKMNEAQAHLSRVTSQVIGLVDTLGERPREGAPSDPGAAEALQRVIARADSVRTGVPPTSLPEQSVLQVQLGALLSLLPPVAMAPPPPSPGAPPVVPEVVPEVHPVPVQAPPPEPAPAGRAPPPPEPTPAPMAPPPPEPEPVAPPPPPAEAPPPPEIPPPPAVPPPSPLVPDHAIDELPPPPPPDGPVEPSPVPVVAEAAPVAPPAEVATPVANDSAPETPPPVAVTSLPPAHAPEPATPPTSGVPLAAREAVVAPRGHAPATVPPGPPAKVSKQLPPPPKPRSPITDVRVVRPSPAPPTPHPVVHEEPPPLPRAQVPAWLAPTPPPASSPRAETHAGRPSAASAGTGRGVHGTTAPAALSPAKRRRKAAPPGTGRKGASVPKEPAEHPPPHPDLTTPSLSVSVPSGSVGEGPVPTHPVPQVPAKVRRKPPRKRKAPPVVSVEVEPLPADARRSDDEARSPDDPVDPPTVREE